MAARPLFTALGFMALAASSGTVDAQLAGYPNNGGRIPGTVAVGPQFPSAAGATPTQAPNYGSQPVYTAPPLNSYTPPRGTDPVNGAPAVSYGTPVGGPIAQGPIAQGPIAQGPIAQGSIAQGSTAQGAAQPALTAPTPAPPLSTPISTPVVSAPASNTSLPPVYSPPVVARPTYAPPTTPIVVSQAPPTSAPIAAPAIPTLAPQASNVLPTPNATIAPGSSGYVAPPVYGAYNSSNSYTPPTPDLSTPPAIPQYAPNNNYNSYNGAATGEMPVGRLTQQEISPYAHGSQPPKYTSWLPRMWTPGKTPVFDNTPANSNYGATYPNESPVAQSGSPYPGANCYPGTNCGPGVPCPCVVQEPWYANFAAISTLDAFKTPMDLDGLNANFGKRVGLAGSFPIWREMGFGGQVSSTAAWYDWKGSQFTGHDTRFQNFNTVGLFYRSCSTGLGFGVAHDWLYDDYYAQFHMSQFRVATAWEVNCNNEIGFWGALPQRRDSAFVGAPAVNNQFQSLLQGNLYWKHYWSDWAWTSTYAGLAESPSDISYGANVQVAVNNFIAVTGAATYVLPGSGGDIGRQEEIWNLSFGFLFYPGTAMAAQRSQFRPMFAPADNGNFATWRK